MRKDQYVIYHNPRCSKSRATLNLLEINPKSKNYNINIQYYLEPALLNETLLLQILDILEIKVLEICRTGEKIFKELGLKKTDPDYKIFEAIIKNPILLQRPIVIKNNKTGIIGRPPENIFKLIDA